MTSVREDRATSLLGPANKLGPGLGSVTSACGAQGVLEGKKRHVLQRRGDVYKRLKPARNGAIQVSQS